MKSSVVDETLVRNRKRICLYPFFHCEELIPVQFVVALVVFVTPFADPKIIFVLPSCFLMGLGVTIFK